MSKGFITGTNEELIKAYKESRDESYLKELIEVNKGLINLLVSPYLTSIPNSELEDLTSESYIPMLRAIEDYDPEQGVAFSTLLRLHAEGEYEIIRTPERLKEVMETYLTGVSEYVLDVETTGLDVYNDILVGICLYNPDLPISLPHFEVS